MGVGRIFSREGPLVDFSKNFSRSEAKVVKFVCSYSKLRKQPFLLKFLYSIPPHHSRGHGGHWWAQALQIEI